jgi:hypothetical protein
MQNLAKAVVDVLAFLELSGDDVIDPDSAVKAMESIAATLHDASEEERAALAEAAMSELNRQSAADATEEVLDFYEHLLADLGLEEEAADASEDDE